MEFTIVGHVLTDTQGLGRAREDTTIDRRQCTIYEILWTRAITSAYDARGRRYIQRNIAHVCVSTC